MIKINHRIASVQGSPTLAITAKAKELKAKGKDVVNFAAGEPDFDTPQRIKEAAIRAIHEGQTKYTPSIGRLDLRELIARKLEKENRVRYSPGQIAVSCGAKHSIFNIIQVLCDEGEEVLIPAPYWVSYPEMVKISGAKPKFLTTSADQAFKITADQLEAAITEKTRLLILNSPSNPTGMVYSPEELEAIAEVCVRRKIFVISDEIYEKLIYDTGTYISLASLNEEIYRQTITVNGVSKAYSMTGWRIGYAAGPEEIMGAVKRLQDHSTSNPCSISQAAAVQALLEPEETIAAMRDLFARRRDLMMRFIDDIDGVRAIRPEGAFYLFCDVSRFGPSMDTAGKILEDVNVALIPGEGFGAPGYLRLSFATSEERIEEGMRRIADWVGRRS